MLKWIFGILTAGNMKNDNWKKDIADDRLFFDIISPSHPTLTFVCCVTVRRELSTFNNSFYEPFTNKRTFEVEQTLIICCGQIKCYQGDDFCL